MAARVPRSFPAGTKFVVEGEDAADGGLCVVARYLVYPNGRRVDLPAGAPRMVECCARRTRSAALRDTRVRGRALELAHQ